MAAKRNTQKMRHNKEELITPALLERDNSDIDLPSKTLPKTLFVLPLAERPFFPAQTLPILMSEDPWLDTVKKIGDTPAQVGGLLLVKSEDEMDATQDDFRTAGPELARDFIGPGSICRESGYAHEIGRIGEIDVVEILVHKVNFDLGRSHRCQNSERKRRNLKSPAGEPLLPALASGGCNEGKLQVTS